MSNASEREGMVGGYGSDDKVQLNTGDEAMEQNSDADASQIPGVLADVSPEASNQGQNEPSGPAGANELGSNATGVDNLAGGTQNYTSGGGTEGFGKGST